MPKTSQRAKDQTFDSLPEYKKAEELFRIRYKYAVTHANGMERLVFKVLPYNLIRSLALTFDPTERFRLASSTITTANRTRTRTVRWLKPARVLLGTESVVSRTQNPNASLCIMLPSVDTNTFSNSSLALTVPPVLPLIAKDTTRRTRPIGSDMGTCEFMTHTTTIPERRIFRYDSHQQQNGNDTCHLFGTQTVLKSSTRQTVGGAAYFSTANMTSLRSAVVTRTNDQITNRLPGMLKTTLASSQRYSLVRNVIELKDLPRSILSLRHTLEKLEQTFRNLPRNLQQTLKRVDVSAKDIPNEWLSFWFGWVTTWKALEDLIDAPAKITKDINFLIDRRGKPTTIRRQSKFAGDGSTTPAFTFNPGNIHGTGWSDLILSEATTHTWEHEIRLVVNMTFDFPTLGVPELRKQLWIRKLGLVPTPTDVYNLIPWTWLVDWFTGLGNYVELIDTINTDPAIINWGIVTGVTTGKITSQATCEYKNRISRATRHNFDTPIVHLEEPAVRRVLPAILDYKCVVRKDIPSGLGVKEVLKPGTLSSYQNSIVGAILAQRLRK